ncbi:MAG: uroporphyrinogen decarboxylase [Bradymonadia bacterium]
MSQTPAHLTDPKLQNSLFLKACRGEATPHTPIWLMRQAGRYMSEYRAVRAKHDFLEVCHTPELALEVTLQPINAFDLDASILFSDLLIPLEPMGAVVKFPKGGPVIENPIESVADVEKLIVTDARETMGFVGDACALIRNGLPDTTPLIGFAGAPYTLASYLIEGGSTRNFLKTKTFLYEHPEAAEALFEKLADQVISLLNMQVDRGCSVVQIFDSWAGSMDPADYERWGARYTRRIVEGVRRPGVPVIVFAKGTGTYFDLVAGTGADVLGVDWTLPLEKARAIVGDGVTLQGNLDPARLLSPWSALKPAVDVVLDAAGDGTGHIFNLGHGITPKTPVDTVKRLVDYVHEASAKKRGE